MLAARKNRRKFMLLLPLVTVLIAMLWYWRPWHRPIVIREGNNPRDGAAMVWVPAGTFRMGTDHLRVAVRNRDWKEARHALRRRLKGQEGSNEAPSRTVYLDGYWIYKYEVTVKQYRAYCRATNRQMPEMPWGGWRDNDPIVNVSWHDATEYAVWAGASLPTEAQWEKAARGLNGWTYPWGNFWDGTKCSNSVDAGAGAPPSPIGSFPTGISPYGAHDMAGNVEEWCLDFLTGITTNTLHGKILSARRQADLVCCAEVFRVATIRPSFVRPSGIGTIHLRQVLVFGVWLIPLHTPDA
jgi:formylglycine-generating enzyme required for sulfatase activity